MRLRVQIFLNGFLSLAISSIPLMGDSGDVEGSHDYPGFPRAPGFTISDYDEDNPAEFNFPVARPLPADANHVETVHVQGHRYVIRYELAPGGSQRTLLQTQQYYEKQASSLGFTVEKTGAVGDVTETFHLKKAGRHVWVYLEPAMSANILTVMESREVPPPSTSSPVGPAPSASAAANPPAIAPATEDPFYIALKVDGSVVLPVTFPSRQTELDTDAQPLIDRVVRMLQLHPDLQLRVEGHTDNAGDPAANQRLSAARARAVRAMLIAGGVDKSRIVAVGLGGLKPMADNGTAEGRKKNRRIELVVPKDTPSPPPFHPPAPNGINYYPANGNTPGSSTPNSSQ